MAHGCPPALKGGAVQSSDQVGLSRNLPLPVSDSLLFLAPHALAVSACSQYFVSWLVKKLGYDHASDRRIARRERSMKRWEDQAKPESDV
jgi:hypothetical protein